MSGQAQTSGFGRPIHMRIGRSRRLIVLLALMHAGALASIPMIASAWVQLIAAFIVSASAWRAYARYIGGRHAPVRELVWRANGSCEVTTPAGTERGVLDSAEWVQPWLTVFTLRLDSGRKVPVILLPDNVAAEPFRRLRVQLRWGPAAESASEEQALK